MSPIGPPQLKAYGANGAPPLSGCTTYPLGSVPPAYPLWPGPPTAKP
jgi:hypothetical protein